MKLRIASSRRLVESGALIRAGGGILVLTCLAIALSGCTKGSGTSLRAKNVKVTARVDQCDRAGCPFVLEFQSLEEERVIQLVKSDLIWSCPDCRGSWSFRPVNPACGSVVDQPMERLSIDLAWEVAVLKPGQTYTSRPFPLDNPELGFPGVHRMLACSEVELTWWFDSLTLGMNPRQESGTKPNYTGTILLRQSREHR